MPVRWKTSGASVGVKPFSTIASCRTTLLDSWTRSLGPHVASQTRSGRARISAPPLNNRPRHSGQWVFTNGLSLFGYFRNHHEISYKVGVLMMMDLFGIFVCFTKESEVIFYSLRFLMVTKQKVSDLWSVQLQRKHYFQVILKRMVKQREIKITTQLL